MWPKKDREAVPMNAETATSEPVAVSRLAVDLKESYYGPAIDLAIRRCS